MGNKKSAPTPLRLHVRVMDVRPLAQSRVWFAYLPCLRRGPASGLVTSRVGQGEGDERSSAPDPLESEIPNSPRKPQAGFLGGSRVPRGNQLPFSVFCTRE